MVFFIHFLTGRSVFSEIHQVDADADLVEAAFFLDLFDPGGQEFAGVHEAGKDEVVLFRYIAELSFVLGQEEDGIVIEFVVFPLQNEFVIDPDGVEDGGILEVGGAGHEGVKEVDARNRWRPAGPYNRSSLSPGSGNPGPLSGGRCPPASDWSCRSIRLGYSHAAPPVLLL